VDLDVVVDGDAGDRPLAIGERLGRQRPQRRPFQSLEELATAGAYTRMGRAFRSLSNSAMRVLSAAREKKVSWRSRARIHRSAIRTPASIVALSRGLAGRAGKMAVP
jgi:hypothetical protein